MATTTSERTHRDRVPALRPGDATRAALPDATRCRSATTCRCCRACSTSRTISTAASRFRWSCRMAICGSCGHDGQRRAAAVLPHLPARLLPRQGAHRAAAALPDRARPGDRPDRLPRQAGVGQAVPGAAAGQAAGRRRAPADTRSRWTEYYSYSQCINCLLCYAACPQYGLDSASPARPRWRCCTATTPTRATRAGPRAAELVNAEQGVWGCTLVGYCSEVCPKGVDPAHAINQNKVNSTLDYFRPAASC